MNYNKLPIYDITLEDETQGIRFISIVADPAIEEMAMKFSLEDEMEYQFKAIKDKQFLAGPAMVPGKLILRVNPKNKEDMYFVRFTADVIEQMAAKFMAENNNRSINVDHEDRMVKAYIQECWIIKSETYDKSRFYGFNNLPIGTFFIGLQIEDEQFWKQEVIDLDKFGFSIEGYMGQKLVEFQKEQFSKQDYLEFFDTMTLDEAYEIFINANDIPMHPNCRCEIEGSNENALWIIMPDACKFCRAAQKEFNNFALIGDFETAGKIYEMHTGKKFILKK